ncbi:hypothetical protein C0995_001109 [Termitomyces sp. Mi166|nr:hypothetical protein C0995_001109 [Termitomyces sp. Mi166\
MQFTLVLGLALTFIFAQFGALAAPVVTTRSAEATEKRQVLQAIGGVACNAARLKTVANLAGASLAVQKVSSAAASDPAASNAASNAAGGLNQAKGAIAEIAGQILTGQVPSAEARNQTLDGLTAAKNALAGITSSTYRSDSGVTDAVSAAASKVDDTIAAGGQVVANC